MTSSAARFITKDSHPTIRAISEAKGLKPRGYRYSTYHANQPGGIQVKDLVLGMQFACLSITDDEPDTLKKVGVANPWQVRAMTMITGSEDEAHQPLSTILRDHYQLQTDHILNVSGVSAAGHALDTQGFMAHNDTTIVLAYRCTTSVSDWLTNLTTTSSAWEIDHDVAQGHSGYFSSCLDFECCSSSDDAPKKPRVHTGFYNNFLVTVPAIKQYIDPLLAADQPPRTLYVVGHSLGAGIAIMAACYFLTEKAEDGIRNRYDWRTLPHKLRVVTAGGPRACCQSMQERVDAVLRELRYTDKVVLARMVRDKDVVPTVPPELFGFRHLTEKLVYITREDAVDGTAGSVLINPDFRQVLPKKTLAMLLKQNPNILAPLHPPPLSENDDDDDESVPSADGDQDPADDDNVDDRDDNGNADETEQAAAKKLARYEKRVKLVPRAFRDHMPEFYLRPLLHLQEREFAVKNLNDWDDDDDESTTNSASQGYYEPLKSRGSTCSSVEASPSKLQQPERKGLGRLFRLGKRRNHLKN